MATCRICGNCDHFLPESWTNWECEECAEDELRANYGTYSQGELAVKDTIPGDILMADH